MSREIAHHRAHTAEEAVDLLGRLGDEATVIAGGQSLMVLLALGLARPSALVDVDRIPDLDYIEADGDALRIGALTRHAQVERHDGDLGSFDVLRRAAGLIGFPAIRERGTFGGNLAHADPTGEWCVLARLLDAEIVAAGPGGRRIISSSEFFRGLLTTALEPDELLLEVRFPHRPQCADLQEIEPRHPDFFTLIAAAAFDLDGGKVARPKVALGGVASEPLRVAEVEGALEGAEAAPEAFREAGALASRSIELYGAEEGRGYAREAVAVLVERALSGALRRAPA